MRLVFEVYMYFLFFIKTLFPGGLLPTFPHLLIPHRPTKQDDEK